MTANVYKHVHLYMCVCMHVYEHMHICKYGRVCVCYVGVCISLHVSTRALCTHVFIYAYVGLSP